MKKQHRFLCCLMVVFSIGLLNIVDAKNLDSTYTLQLNPSTVVLRGGHVKETLHLEIRDKDGELICPSGLRISFVSSNPSLVQVDDSGTVTSTGSGEAEITATVSDIPGSATAKVIAGHFRIEPPILLLSVTDEPTARLTLNAANADGTPLNLVGRNISFSGGNSVAGVDTDGVVTAYRPPQSFYETPYITAFLDGVPSHNATIVRVTQDSLGLTLLLLEQTNIVFYIPEQIGTFNYLQIFNDYDVARITNLAYQLEEELMGIRPFYGDVQFLVNDPGHGADDTVPCGISGNPIRLGTDVDKYPHNSCLIVAYPPATPQWGIYFHEMGHNFTWASVRFAQLVSGSNVDNSNFSYSEGLATAMGMYAAKMMQKRAERYEISAETLNTILPSVWHFGNTPDLDAYVNNGANYSQINPSILDDIIMVLADEYGYEILYRFFSIFLPSDAPLPYVIDSDAKQATFFVAAMNAATGTDLRTRFLNEWGFPLDDSFYDQIYLQVEQIVAQRDPATDVRTINLPKTGQTKCYDTTGKGIPCTETGQDGEIRAGVAWPELRFTTNADFTIQDNLTGLVWAPDGNIMPTRDPGWDADGIANDGRVTWQHALDYVTKLNSENYLEHNDWRLPNVNELEGLENADEANIATWLNAQGFTKVQAGDYWSSTTCAEYPEEGAWYISMWSGYVSNYSKSNEIYVWPVCGGQSCNPDPVYPSNIWKTGQTISYYTGDDGDLEWGVAYPVPRFTDLGNGTVGDNLTGLIWAKSANLPVGTWQQALDSVTSLNSGHYLGYSDWRLPNRKELHSLTDFSQYGPALPAGHPFTNVQADAYWSSTTIAFDSGDAWYVRMNNGSVDGFYKSGLFSVWPVRGGQIECSTWTDVISKYNDYVAGQTTWNDVITCYTQYASK